METLQKIVLGLGSVVSSFFGLLGPASLPPTPPSQVNLAPRAVTTMDFRVAAKLNQLKEAVGGNIRYTTSDHTGYLRFLAGTDRFLLTPPGLSDEAENTSRQFLTNYGLLFGIEDQKVQMKLIQIQDEGADEIAQGLQFKSLFHFDTADQDLDMMHVRFQQIYQEVPIFGAQLVVHLTSEGRVSAANGGIVPNPSVDVKPTILAERAQEIVRDLWSQEFLTQEVQLGEPVLTVLNPSFVSTGADENFLTWKIEAKNAGRPIIERWFYFIDAHTGELVFRLQGIFKAKRWKTYDCNSTFTCPLAREDNGADLGIADVDNVHNFAGATYDYYANAHGRDSYDNSGGTIISYARIPDFFKGYLFMCPQAFWDGSSLNFCPGVAARDVVAHEYTHWVTGETADLIYVYQSGALNESFSDIFGAAVDNDDWQMGEDTILGVIRSLADPTSKGDPDRLFSDLYYCGSGDEGGVHQNSTIQSHAAYLMAEGGSFNGCTISGIGREKEEKIFYRTLVHYLTPSDNFRDAYDAALQSCADLFGAGSSECAHATGALQAVEMDQQPAGEQRGARCLGETPETPACANGTTPTPTPTPTSTPTPTPTSTPTGSPTATPTGTPTPTPSPTPSPTPTPTPTSPPTPAPTPVPGNWIILKTADGTELTRGARVRVGAQAQICYHLDYDQDSRIEIQTAAWTKQVINPFARGECYWGRYGEPYGTHTYILRRGSGAEVARTHVEVISWLVR